MDDMVLIRAVNDHFQPFYPHIAEQAMGAYRREEGDVLEIGPYCPGIFLALAERCPGLRIVLGDDRPETNAYFREQIAAAGLDGRVEVRHIDKFALGFGEGSFDWSSSGAASSSGATRRGSCGRPTACCGPAAWPWWVAGSGRGRPTS